MTTARERYEQKTKVITYRVSNEFYDQIEEVKAKTGLSNADLMKLGAGIASEEVKNKLAEASALGAKLANLKEDCAQVKQRIDKELLLSRLQISMHLEALQLFVAGWHVEEVAQKLGITNIKAVEIVKEWDKLETDRETTKRELLRTYVKKHLQRLKYDNACFMLEGKPTAKDMEDMQGNINLYQFLFNNPSELSDEEKEFLTAEYS